jgi:hypothetical protein
VLLPAEGKDDCYHALLYEAMRYTDFCPLCPCIRPVLGMEKAAVIEKEAVSVWGTTVGRKG